MRIPSLPSRILGHPIIATLLTLGGLAFLYVCWQAEAGFPAFLTLIALTMVGKASQQMNAHRDWQSAWNSMAVSGPRRWAGWWRKPLGVLMVAGVALYVASRADEAEYRLALGWMVLVAIIAVVAILWRTIRRQQRTKRAATVTPVTICARPVMKPMTLEAAYRALPDYCQQVMQP